MIREPGGWRNTWAGEAGKWTLAGLRGLSGFSRYFAPLFGRRETRDHSRHYLQALLVQSGERRNAENLSETVPASARVAAIPLGRRHSHRPPSRYLGPRLGHPEGVWVLDGSDFPKQGRKSTRQGETGQANCQAGIFLAYVSPLGRALVDGRCFICRSWTSDQDRFGRGSGGEAGLPVEDEVGWRCSGPWSRAI